MQVDGSRPGLRLGQGRVVKTVTQARALHMIGIVESYTQFLK